MPDGRLSVCVPLSSLSSTTHTSCFRTALPVASRVPGGPLGVSLFPAQLAPCCHSSSPLCTCLRLSYLFLNPCRPPLPRVCLLGASRAGRYLLGVSSVCGATGAASPLSTCSKLIFLLDKRRPNRVALPGPQATKDRWTKHLHNPWWLSAPCRTSFKTGNCS